MKQQDIRAFATSPCAFGAKAFWPLPAHNTTIARRDPH